MKTTQHNAVIITAFDKENAIEIREKIISIIKKYEKEYVIKANFTNAVSEVKKSVINEDYSFCLFPDGSKEGWSTSNEFDKIRTEIREYLNGNETCYWVEVSYGEIGSNIIAYS